MQTDCQRGETSAVHRVGEAGVDGADVGVEVVQAARTDIGDVHKRRAGQDLGTTALKSECLLAKGGIDLDQRSASGDLLGNSVASRLDDNSTSRLEQTDNVDNILHRLPSVRSTLEIILARVGRSSTRGSIGSIAVEALEVATVPVNKLILLDVLGDVCIFTLVRSDERLGEIKPAVVGHVVRPLGCSVIGVLVLERANIMRLAVVIPGEDFDHGEALFEDFVPAVKDKRATRENPVLDSVSQWRLLLLRDYLP
jgi:hypothetical protein